MKLIQPGEQEVIMGRGPGGEGLGIGDWGLEDWDLGLPKSEP